MLGLTLLLCLGQLPANSPLSREGLDGAERGLRYLARTQEASGGWRGDVGYKLQDQYQTWRKGAEHLGVTSLAGMAFLAGGHVPGRGPYGETVQKAVDYILKYVRSDGYITGNETRMYSHAFATLFLAEVYGMTEREDVRDALQRAVHLIVASQNSQGGWRYQPHVADADMSVTVCQVVALRAARNIGIQVPVNTIDRAIKYVRDSAVRDNEPPGMSYFADPVGSFRYQPTYEARATFALTAAGVTTLHGAGVYGDAEIERGLQYLESEVDDFSRLWGLGHQGHYFFYYGHYYAVQAFHMAGGRRYQNYFKSIQSYLLRMQNAAGWWPNHQGPGRNFSTAVACLILQIPKEYLPIFQR
ncbi:MAG: prenyltransferase [Planctomycetota bacterium]|nr:MAG: prenyltransferase [Planctomycetota bacterium]